MAKVAADLAYLSRFSLAEDLRVFLQGDPGKALVRIPPGLGAVTKVAGFLFAASAWFYERRNRHGAAKTTLFVKNYVNSNEIPGIVFWRGLLAMGTLGGIVTLDPGLSSGQRSASLRLAAVRNALEGEIRDLAGTVIHRFHCDPASNQIWDLRNENGERAPSGVYLVVIHDKSGSKTLRAAVVR